MESLPESWQLFIEQYDQFTKLHRQLAKEAWFQDGEYSVYIGHYFAGIYMQVYRAHWFNYGLDGIHFETGMTAESLAEKSLRLDLHIGHRNLFDREQLNELTIPQMKEVVTAWGDRYHLSTRNLSERLHVIVPFTKTGFAKQITAEFTKLCTELGPIIDDGLAQL